jgi:hypothetical protein
MEKNLKTFFAEVETSVRLGKGNLFEIMKRYPKDMKLTESFSVRIDGKGNFLPKKEAKQLKLF